MNLRKMVHIAEYLDSFVRKLGDELSSPTDHSTPAPPPERLDDASHPGNDDTRFRVLEEWFDRRLQPALDRAGLTRSGDLISDLRWLREILAGGGGSG